MPDTDTDSKNNFETPNLDPKKISFIFQALKTLAPNFFIFDTYRGKEFSRIDKTKNYGGNLDYRNESIAEICKIKPFTHVSELAFLSHAKRQSFAIIPYSGAPSSGKKKQQTKKAPKIPKNKILKEKINTDFHLNKNFRASFKGKIRERTDGIMKDLQDKNIEEYLYERLSKNIIPKTNDVILITGDIGCGKSTLLTNALYRVAKDNKDAEKNTPKNFIKVEFILIDFEELPIPELNDDISLFTKNVVNGFLLNRIKEVLKLTGDNIESVLKKVPKLTKLILAFDNLDALYTEFCKQLFIKNDYLNNDVEIKKYYPFIYTLISQFTIKNHSELEIRCIFAVRNETVELLQDGICVDDGDETPFDTINVNINISATTGEYVNEVIEKRMSLIQANISDEDTKSLLADNKTNIAKSAPMFEEINLLSIQGLRHTMSVCMKLSWAFQDHHSFKRFFIDGVATRIFHYLGGKTNYSQIHEGITNIFLVNNSYRRENNQETKNGEKLFAEKDFEDHLQTYWLKYFILDYVHKNTVDKTEVIRFFTNNGKTGYPESIVRLIIYSLSEIKHGRLIKPKISFQTSDTIRSSGITCTERAEHLLKSSSFWSFCYLSLIIEDEWLEFPTFLKNKFSYPIGFDFLFCSDNEVYHEKFYDYLLNKSELVLIFLDILEVSLKYEKKKHSEVFKYLLLHDVDMPNFEEIRSNIVLKINELSLSLTEEKQKAISEKIDKANNFSDRKKLKKKLNKLFAKTYYTGLIGKVKLAASGK